MDNQRKRMSQAWRYGEETHLWKYNAEEMAWRLMTGENVEISLKSRNNMKSEK